MKIKTSITLSENLVKEIDKFLGRKGNRSALVEQALRDYLTAKKQQVRYIKDFKILHQRADELNTETQEVLSHSDGQICHKTDSDVKAQPIECVVQGVVQSHFEIEPEIDEIVWFKKGADREICLLEINRDTLPAGNVLTFYFAPAPPEVPFPVIIADVTPQEWEQVKLGDIPLPPGWSLQEAQTFRRPKE
jgi:predicted transcriptional regulator